MSSFEITTSLKKILRLKAKTKVIQGATSSGKTFNVIPILYDRALETPNTLITVVAETIPALKDGCVKIFKDFMYNENRWRDDCWIGNPMEYTLPNRSKIQFKSFDSEGKAKASGKREILFINEANHVPYLIADALMIRTTREVILDFNADSEFWAHTEVLKEPNSELLKLTYMDNEAIPIGTLDKLLNRKKKAEEEEAKGERGYWWNWWQVYGLGEVGNLQGVIFNNWEQVDAIPQNAKLVGYGMDFGYTNDPTTCVAIYQMDGKSYFDEILYSSGLTNMDIYNSISHIVGTNLIYADSAEPKSIDELRRLGLVIKGAAKGADSIIYGINKIQECKFYVTSSSINLITELRNYQWQKDRTGKAINKPIDDYNHLIDAIRYGLELTTKKRYSALI